MTATTAVDADCLVRRVSLGGSVLSIALQQRQHHEWLEPIPAETSAWVQRVHSVRDAAQRNWLTTIEPAFGATGPAAQRLARAAESGVVVTTGQQPGLFGGPMYTFSKAISALAFADELQQATGVPVAPVFWAATDDADWHEASTTYVVNAQGLDALTLNGPATDGIAMADVPLGDVELLVQRLRAASGSAAFHDVLDLVERAYVPHATVGASYVQLLRGLLEPLGIAVLDAAHPALREATDPLLRHALREASAVAASLEVRTADITRAGFAPQVDLVDGLSLVFSTSPMRDAPERRIRERVPLENASRVAREAERGTLGANVLLRPVLERALLPTVAYHAGPGELAYFAQATAVAKPLGMAAPLGIPRWSGEVIERSALRALERLGLDEASLLTPHEAEMRVARAAMHDEVSDSLERLRVATETQVRALRDAVQQAGAIVSDSVVDGLARDLGFRMDRFERRLLASVKRREQEKIRDLAVARAALRPLGKSPERVLNLIPAIARYGTWVFEQMRASARQHANEIVQGSPAAS